LRRWVVLIFLVFHNYLYSLIKKLNKVFADLMIDRKLFSVY